MQSDTSFFLPDSLNNYSINISVRKNTKRKSYSQLLMLYYKYIIPEQIFKQEDNTAYGKKQDKSKPGFAKQVQFIKNQESAT